MASRKIKFGALLLALGIVALLVGFGPARFVDRFSGRVDVEGTVQWGISIDARSAQDRINDGEQGVWKVDYTIDGAEHTGAIIGTYRIGQVLAISAPSDGSFYSPLREATSLPMKILSWILTPLGAAATIVGAWMLIVGVRARDRQARAQAHAQLAQRYPQLFPLPTAPQAMVAGQQSAPSSGSDTEAIPAGKPSEQSTSKPDFYAPYDL